MPHFVQFGNDHHSSAGPISRQGPIKCALCSGNHPANHKGCTVYKDLQHRKKRYPNNHNLPVNFRFKPSNVQDSHPLNTTSSNHPPFLSHTYAQATHRQPFHHAPPPLTPESNSQLPSFLNEFNPLISLLTKVISILLNKK